MKQHELAPPPGAKRRSKRIGRGLGSGHGRLSGRGGRGQGTRENVRPGFEGGQLPLYRRVSVRRGFRNPFRVEYVVVNISQLEAFPANSTVTPEVLLRNGLVKSSRKPVKILGEGEVTKSLIVKAHKFSASAKEKLEKAGGKAEELVQEAAG